MMLDLIPVQFPRGWARAPQLDSPTERSFCLGVSGGSLASWLEALGMGPRRGSAVGRGRAGRLLARNVCASISEVTLGRAGTAWPPNYFTAHAGRTGLGERGRRVEERRAERVFSPLSVT